MIEEYAEMLKQVGHRKSTYQDIFKRLRRKKGKKLDALFQEAHDEVFAEIDCMSCANCCTDLGPRINSADITRLSKDLSIKDTHFKHQYLRKDEDGDFVFKDMPCPFLHADNVCFVYEKRPRACREYPHSDESPIRLQRMEKDLDICPAIGAILQLVDSKLDQ
jgi:Fe-S-cluster containining protein